MKKAPLSRVKDEFGSKDKLVDAVLGVVDAGDEDKNELRQRLQGASNSKLLKLLATGERVKAAGGREKLIDAVLEARGRSKDKDYRSRLARYTTGRLYDLYASHEKASRAVASAPKKATKKKGKAA